MHAVCLKKKFLFIGAFLKSNFCNELEESFVEIYGTYGTESPISATLLHSERYRQPYVRTCACGFEVAKEPHGC